MEDVMSNQLVSIQDYVGALLLEWGAFKEGEASAAAVEQLIERVAAKAEVAMFATEGEQVQFKPFEHFLIEEPSGEVKQVTVIKSGAQATRPDGSTRVVSRALVTTKT
jgi:hypothetical protein